MNKVASKLNTNKGQRKPQLPRQRKQNPKNKSKEINPMTTCRFKKTELWGPVEGTRNASMDYRFSNTQYPPWFKQFAQLFESYVIHNIEIKVVSTSSKMDTGLYAFYLDVNKGDRPETVADICAQYGSKMMQISQSGSMYYGKEVFRQQYRYLTHNTDEYPFTLYINAESNTNIFLQVYITYDVTFYVPQLSNQGSYNIYGVIDNSATTVTSGDAGRQYLKVKAGDVFAISTDAAETVVETNGVQANLFRQVGSTNDFVMNAVALDLLGNASQLVLSTVDNSQTSILGKLTDLLAATHLVGVNSSTLRNIFTISGRAIRDFVIRTGTRYIINSFTGK